MLGEMRVVLGPGGISLALLMAPNDRGNSMVSLARHCFGRPVGRRPATAWVHVLLPVAG